jgi:hypothetical protein
MRSKIITIEGIRLEPEFDCDGDLFCFNVVNRIGNRKGCSYGCFLYSYEFHGWELSEWTFSPKNFATIAKIAVILTTLDREHQP